MGWVLRLVETGAESPVQGIDVMEISRPRDLGDIASLGLTLPEAKQLLARVQQTPYLTCKRGENFERGFSLGEQTGQV